MMDVPFSARRRLAKIVCINVGVFKASVVYRRAAYKIKSESSTSAIDFNFEIMRYAARNVTRGVNNR